MFDPTAFDNMKVVIEGALYDKDLQGEISIVDRNDLINLAKMSRSFNIAFKLPDKLSTALFHLESSLTNLAAELVPLSLTNQAAGCNVKLRYHLQRDFSTEELKSLEKYLLEVWGEQRIVTITVNSFPLHNQPQETKITVEFGRLILEDQMEDLIEMAEVLITSLNKLE